MGTERFNRQFILVDFKDLDNPEFMEFVRSPEFSTYLLLRRYIWRSVERAHSLGLHQYYSQGLLASALSREKIADALGGISLRQVSRDIKSLVGRNLIKPVRTGRGNIFILGRWGRDEEDNVYYEYYFLDRLQTRPDENVISDMTSQTRPDTNVRSVSEPENQTRQKRQVSIDTEDQTDQTGLSDNNRERNRELNIEKRKKISNSKSPSTDEQLSFLQITIKTCSRDFNDLDHLKSNITRAKNIWQQTELSESEFVAQIYEARKVTKQRISRSAVHDRDKKMAYFFAVLEDILGLKETSSTAVK